MSDYIKRDVLLEARELAICAYENAGIFNADAIRNHLKLLLDAVADTPAADVAEVVFARWEEADWREYDAQSCETIRYPKAAIVCTNCRCAFKKDALWKRDFCPSCGAKMNGGDSNAAD